MADTSTTTTTPQQAQATKQVEGQQQQQHTIVVQLVQPKEAAPVHWSVFVTPAVALLAAAIAGVIAYKNWRTAQAKLKLDAFEKRVAVFEQVMRVRDMVRDYDEDDPSDEFTLTELVTFAHETLIRARFLFNKKLTSQIDIIYNQAFGFAALVHSYNHERGPEGNAERAIQAKDALTAVRDSIREKVHLLHKPFSEEIRIDHH